MRVCTSGGARARRAGRLDAAPAAGLALARAACLASTRAASSSACARMIFETSLRHKRIIGLSFGGFAAEMVFAPILLSVSEWFSSSFPRDFNSDELDGLLFNLCEIGFVASDSGGFECKEPVREGDGTRNRVAGVKSISSSLAEFEGVFGFRLRTEHE